METKVARTSEGMLCGAYVGKIRYFIDPVKDVCIYEKPNDSIDNIVVMTAIMDSIFEKEHVCLNDICNRISEIKNTGSILYAISPLTFADIFGLHHHELDDTIRKIVNVMNQDEKIQSLCVEFIHLLHDILWFKIDKTDILNILPEFDILESEVICSTQEKDIFFAALWSFIFSEDYVSCYEKASNLKDTNSDIVGLACTFAGLYYGVDSIPTDWSEQVFDINLKKADGTDLIFKLL